MAGNVQRDTADKLRVQILSQAHNKAATVLAETTPLSLAAARAVAPDVVDAVTPAIRAEHAQMLAGVTAEQVTRLSLAAVGVLALDLTMFAAVAVCGPRWVRPVAVAAIAAHTTFFLHNRRQTSRVRTAARVETARGNATAGAA